MINTTHVLRYTPGKSREHSPFCLYDVKDNHPVISASTKADLLQTVRDLVKAGVVTITDLTDQSAPDRTERTPSDAGRLLCIQPSLTP